MKPADIDELCECAICQGILQDAHICPSCSNPFCHGCIQEWLFRRGNCPACRKPLNGTMLVKARFYQQVQDVIRSSAAPVCGAHLKQISLFCGSCVECICLNCMFGKAHAGHRDRVVLCESAATDIKARVSNELGWIQDREREITNAIGLHAENLQKLAVEKDRVFKNIQQVLDDVNGQFKRGRVQQQKMISLLELDQKDNAELLQISREWIKTEKILVFLPKIANLLKTNRFNSSATKPKPVKQIKPEFKNDLIPELVEFKLELKSSQTIRADPGFEFTVQLTRVDVPFYKVNLTMKEGFAGEYSLALGDENPLTSFKFDLLQATPVGRIKLEVPPSTPIKLKLQLAKTYAQKCRQYEEHARRLEKLLEKKQLINRQERKRTLTWCLGGGLLAVVTVVVYLFAMREKPNVSCSPLVRFALEQFCYDT